jgi:alkanesulfonate monooxygenase SsuD/methylene tetrahydromethanopterin reductase-like flavin-dependent oxidoreductase (luciferase family)
VKFAIDVAPFDELADPRLLAELAAAAEEKGWDGFFVWDHIVYRAPVTAVLDPWVALAAVACSTSRVRIGTMITPPSRRRIHKLARETMTLDLLSEGRLTLGVGIGSARNNEFEPFGEVADPRERARLLDQGLADLTRYWSGDFQPVPVQQPRIPVWVASEWPYRRPVRRAARWDGLFPTQLPGPAELAELVSEVHADRAAAGHSDSDPFDVAIGFEPGQDPQPWADAGATWALTAFGIQPALAQVRETIEAGPPQAANG